MELKKHIRQNHYWTSWLHNNFLIVFPRISNLYSNTLLLSPTHHPFSLLYQLHYPVWRQKNTGHVATSREISDAYPEILEPSMGLGQPVLINFNGLESLLSYAFISVRVFGRENNQAINITKPQCWVCPCCLKLTPLCVGWTHKLLLQRQRWQTCEQPWSPRDGHRPGITKEESLGTLTQQGQAQDRWLFPDGAR